MHEPPFAPPSAKFRRRAFVVLVAVTLLVAGAVIAMRDVVADRRPTPLGIEIRSATTLILYTTCAKDVRASVVEAADSVRIDDVDGKIVDGDCLGGVRVHLSDPLGDRVVFVGGEEWMFVGQSCPLGAIGPGEQGGSEISPDCR